MILSALEIIECEQNSPEWYAARRGIVTASCFGDVMAKQRDPKKPGVRKKLMYRLAAEQITGEVVETYRNTDMDRGHEWEPRAVAFYEMTRPGPTPEKVGFGRRGRIGASPDRRIGDHGGLEIKTLRADLMLEAHEKNGDAQINEHYDQIQGNILVFDALWWDLTLFHPAIDPIVRRVERDPEHIITAKKALAEFIGEMDAIVARHKS